MKRCHQLDLLSSCALAKPSSASRSTIWRSFGFGAPAFTNLGKTSAKILCLLEAAEEGPFYDVEHNSMFCAVLITGVLLSLWTLSSPTPPRRQPHQPFPSPIGLLANLQLAEPIRDACDEIATVRSPACSLVQGLKSCRELGDCMVKLLASALLD